mmetsp:Transcript_862/g.2401  ORF Transcript_862/g.2401 Transcript_862/m.2401 type:complete len:191 (-) Transcript_862:774-1346(-)
MAADASDDRRDEAIPASVPQMQQGEDDECEHDIVITSFGHKYGRLRDGVDCMFDVRDVPNPPRMLRRTHTGRSARLMKELAKVPQIEVIATHIHDHLVRIGAQKDPATSSSKRMCLVASIGCECGVHRSVAIAELVARELRSQHKLRVTVSHRDLHRHVLGGAGGGVHNARGRRGHLGPREARSGSGDSN